MIYTIAKMRTFARSIDKRLQDATNYPDSWIDERIEEGLALAQDIKQTVFSTKEKYDLTNNFTVDLLTEVEIILQKEVHSIWAIEYETSTLDIEITANNHIIVRRKENAQMPDDMTVTVRYFFYHTLPLTSVEMSMEVYKLCKSSIASTCFSWLSDKESEQYHMAKAESMVVKSTFDIEKDLMQVPEDRLWRASWA